MFKMEEVNRTYRYDKEDDDSYLHALEVEYHDPYNEEEFTFYGHGPKEKCLGRFTSEEIKKITETSDQVAFLATHGAGISLRFITDSRYIKLRVVEAGIHDMKNMNFMAQCGFDLYYKEGDQYIYHNSTFPNYIDERKYISPIAVFRGKKEREIIINFPLYMGVFQLEVGVEVGSIVKANHVKNKGRIVCYGTSILQGGCVSRPGLCVTNVLSRYFDIDVLNYGFSGAGLLEREVGEIIASRDDIKLLIIDAEANAGCDKWMFNNLEAFLNEFYKKYPGLAVILMNKTRMAIDYYVPRNQRIREFNEKYLRSIYRKYKKKGKEIYFVNNYDLFKNTEFNEFELTVDGVHPNDLGMYLLAQNYIKAVKKVKSLNL